MELFTLGASDETGYPYSEDDVREQARALTGWRADWKDDVGYVNFRFDPEYHDSGTKTIFGKTGQASTGATRAASASSTRRTRRTSSTSSGATSSRSRPPRSTRAQLESLYQRKNYAIKPLLEAILKHPRLLRGPVDGEAADRLHRRHAPRARARASTPTAGRWISDLAGQRPFQPAERRRLGRGALARHVELSRPLDRRLLHHPRGRGRSGRGLRRGRDAVGGRRQGAPLLGQPAIDPATRARTSSTSAGTSRTRSWPTGRRQTYRAPSPERPAADDRDVPRHADVLRRDDGLPLQRVLPRAPPSLRRRRGRAGAAQGSSPGCRCRPAPGSSRRSFMMRAGPGDDVRLRRVEARPARPPGAASREAQGTAAADASSTVFMDGGMDSLSVLAPTEDPRLPAACARRCGSTSARDAGVRRGRPALRWHPRAAALDDLHRAGKLTRAARDRLRRPRPVALHLAPLLGGRRARPERAHRLDGPPDRRIGVRRQPAPGTLARRLALAVAGDGAPTRSRRSTARATTSGRRASGATSRTLMFDAVQSVGRAAAGGGDLGRSGRRPDRRPVDHAAQPARAVRRRGHATGSVSGRRTTGSHATWPRSRRCSTPGLPIRCVSTNAPGGYDTHDNQLDSFGDDIGLTFDTLAAFQADLEARGLADRVLTLVYSEFGRRPEQNGIRDRSRRGRRGVRHGHAGRRARWSASSAGSSDLDEDDNLRHSSDFRALYCSLLEQWFDVDAGGHDPRRFRLRRARDRRVSRGERYPRAALVAARSRLGTAGALRPPSAVSARSPGSASGATSSTWS